MKHRFVTTALVAVAVLALAALASPVEAQSFEDEQAIRDLMIRFTELRSEHRNEAASALWAKDGDYVNPVLEKKVAGPDEIAAMFNHEDDECMADSRWSVLDGDVRFLADGVAVSDWKVLVQNTTITGEPTDVTLSIAVVWTKGEAGWEMASVRPRVPCAK